MYSNYGLCGAIFFKEVTNRIGCSDCIRRCGAIPQNMYYTVMGDIRPMYYFYQVPDSIVKVDTNGYLCAEPVGMQDNFIQYWCHNIKNQEAKNTAQKELRQVFKELLELASKQTERTNLQASLFFDAIGFVMADDFAEALRKAYGIYLKYNKILNNKRDDRSYIGCSI